MTTFIVLTGIACGCAFAVCPLGFYWEGTRGIQLGMMACLACWICGILGIELCRVYQNSTSVYGLALTGILVRMVLPLAMCGATALWAGTRNAQCLAICFILIYPIFLAADTYFVVRMLGRPRNETSAEESRIFE